MPGEFSAITQRFNELNPNINAVPSNIEISMEQQPSTSLVADYTRLNTQPPSGLLAPSNTAASSSAVSVSALPSGTTTFYTPQATPKLPTTTPKPLKVAPNKKAIFAAKFAAETSTDDMLFYLKSKIDIDVELSVYKFKYHGRRTKASFRIIVPEDIFEVVIKPDFWPAKAFIREYIFKDTPRSDVVYLPLILTLKLCQKTEFIICC
ncbi:uncharacterized protein LOC131997271 [Stomoxys calcitrans]|uniref:uncharacterized protein LOC131997271 n=1 Tax=Stomoxys calcitrans TaxID=35570 RepID=UPI0027E3956E|nr:uncharacterized protein LOC131997271 [Stomoxys calcitrans]